MQKILLDGRGIDLADAVHAQALYDVRFLTHRMGQIEKLSELKKIHGFVTRFQGELEEVFLSAGCTASLCGYRRQGATWRYQPARQRTVRGEQIIDALDDLRTLISPMQRTIRALSRVRGQSGLVRAIALAGLALDAIDDDHLALYIDLARIPRHIVDVAGWSMEICERHFSDDPPPRRRLTADPAKAGMAPRRRLTGNPDRATKITKTRV